MTDHNDPKPKASNPKDARAARRKAELKANMARRKAQARMRSANGLADDRQAEMGIMGGLADGPPDDTQG
jgi:hypothetical protein